MPYDTRLREEDLKNKVARDWFGDFDWTPVVGNIDFCVEDSTYNIAYLWAEAKKGSSDIFASFVQLIMTIGKARAFEKRLPPAFLGAFDAEKIAFLPYHFIIGVFSQSDFNWSVTASDHTTKEFKQLYEQVKGTIKAESLEFEFSPKDEKRLRAFIKGNFKPGNPDFTKLEITSNNFVSVYYQDVREYTGAFFTPPQWVALSQGKSGVHLSKIHDKYCLDLGTAGREVFAQFIMRIYKEIGGCVLANFSKMKLIQGAAFNKFMRALRAPGVLTGRPGGLCRRPGPVALLPPAARGHGGRGPVRHQGAFPGPGREGPHEPHQWGRNL